MEEVQISLKDLAGVFGQNADQFIANFTTTDDEGKVKPLTGEEVLAKLTDFGKAEFQRYITEGSKIGKRERMAEFEANIKSKYGVNKATQGEALIDAIVSDRQSRIEALEAELETMKKAAPAAKGLKELSDEEAKTFIVNHPFYTESLSAKAAEVEAVRQEMEQFKQSVERDMLMGAVKESALTYLKNDYRAVLPDVPEMADALTEAFLQKLTTSAQFRKTDKGIEAVDEHGEPVKDENFRIMSFAQYVETVAKRYFKQHPADPNKSTPPDSNNKKTTESGVVIPDWSKMNDTQIGDFLRQEPDAAKRTELTNSAAKYLKSLGK